MVTAPETVKGAFRVNVVVPAMVIVAHADDTSTIGVLALLGIVALSPAMGCPEPPQLELLLQFLFALPPPPFQV